MSSVFQNGEERSLIYEKNPIVNPFEAQSKEHNPETRLLMPPSPDLPGLEEYGKLSVPLIPPEKI